MTVQCCKCKKVRSGERWARLWQVPAGPVSHTYCPTCAEDFTLELFSQDASEMSPLRARRAGQLLASLSASL